MMLPPPPRPPNSSITPFIDPKSMSWRFNPRNDWISQARWYEDHRDARTALLKALGGAGIPQLEWDLIHSTRTLRMRGRMRLICFLWGNGVDQDMIRRILDPLVKRESVKDVDGIVAAAVSGKYDTKWWYYDVKHALNLRLDGTVQDALTDRTRVQFATYEWDRQRQRRLNAGRGYPTLAEQQRFFRDEFDITDHRHGGAPLGVALPYGQ